MLRQFRPAIVRYCRSRLTGTRTRTGSLDEDDVAQEVCLALLSALPSYRDMGRPFGAFVFAIAAHEVADAARGAARAPLPVPVLPDLPDRCLGPEETVLKSVDARLARALLARLPAVQRRLLLLRVVGGLSAEDTDENCPPRKPNGQARGTRPRPSLVSIGWIHSPLPLPVKVP
jgi:RNA polymerase sigma-70 factor (ECF subfamily)